ncbi:MAG: DNA-binding response regulator [Alphaproteobacteria bacterium PA4]|nr:MAG: DNA-binding response regulator [Alphaproteobacteria bacterium PA4]
MSQAAESPIHVILVDDDARLRQLAADHLRQHGFRVSTADGGGAMRAILAREPVDIVVLDIMMPGEDGLSIARSLAGQPDIGIIMVSALGSETDRIVGLEVGADDYLAKPLAPRELVARIRAVMRRRRLTTAAGRSGALLLFDGWRCDLTRNALHDPADVLVSLSQGEFALLRVFLEQPQRVLSRDQLLDNCRASESDAFDRAIDTQVSRLRRKLASRSETEFIRTIRQEGYMFMPRVVAR